MNLNQYFCLLPCRLSSFLHVKTIQRLSVIDTWLDFSHWDFFIFCVRVLPRAYSFPFSSLPKIIGFLRMHQTRCFISFEYGFAYDFDGAFTFHIGFGNDFIFIWKCSYSECLTPEDWIWGKWTCRAVSWALICPY